MAKPHAAIVILVDSLSAAARLISLAWTEINAQRQEKVPIQRTMGKATISQDLEYIIQQRGT